MQARNQRRSDQSDRLDYLDIVGWRVVEMLADAGPWRRYLAVARERAVPDDGDWLAGTAHAASHAAALTAPVSAVELLVEASPGLGLTLSELCELFDEIEAPSVPEILDVGMTEEQEAVAVLEATLGSSVDELLDRPNPLTAGEIVTILAPVVETLVELHEHGVSLGALRCQDVRLTAAGRPVLKDWHAVARLPEVDGRARASVARDWKSLESMADLVLAQLPSQTELPAALERELDRCLSGEVDAQIGHRLLDALFSWQDAREVLDPAAGERAPRNAILVERDPETASLGRLEHPRPTDNRNRADSLLADDSAEEVVDPRRAISTRDAESRRAQRAQRRPATRQRVLSGIRLPYRIAAAAAVVMCVCALMIGLLGGGRGGGTQQGAGPLNPSVPESSAVELTEPEVETEAETAPLPGEVLPTPENAEPVAQESTASDWRAAATVEDPTAAAMALVARRAECLASSPDGCLEELYQSDAPGLHVDLARAEETGDELAGLTTATLRDRYGDFAVVDLWPADAVQASETPPTSLTIARGEAGWRLRDVRVA